MFLCCRCRHNLPSRQAQILAFATLDFMPKTLTGFQQIIYGSGIAHSMLYCAYATRDAAT
ncbi:MAG: hypothetical protein CM15mP120_24380 [Pseudomonadota bacterium]|nr:MAG: hypothetical protein CM15mP120_24380 [Pseudomonadota bacterium]